VHRFAGRPPSYGTRGESLPPRGRTGGCRRPARRTGTRPWWRCARRRRAGQRKDPAAGRGVRRRSSRPAGTAGGRGPGRARRAARCLVLLQELRERLERTAPQMPVPRTPRSWSARRCRRQARARSGDGRPRVTRGRPHPAYHGSRGGRRERPRTAGQGSRPPAAGATRLTPNGTSRIPAGSTRWASAGRTTPEGNASVGGAAVSSPRARSARTCGVRLRNTVSPRVPARPGRPPTANTEPDRSLPTASGRPGGALVTEDEEAPHPPHMFKISGSWTAISTFA
jgi:hypothetical protein